jgi:4-aminobutyrate aminotransferase
LQGNPMCCSAALAVLKTIAGEGLVGHCTLVGEYFMKRLRSLAIRQPLIGDVRGRGLAIGIELVDPIDGRTPARQSTALAVYRAFELGVVMFYVGVHSNVLELTPPLNLSIDEVDRAVDIIERALSDVVAGRVDPALIAPYAGW